MTSLSWIITTPCTGTVIFCDKSPRATALQTRATSWTWVFKSLSSSTALMPLSNAAAARGPGGTTRGEETSPEDMFTILEIVAVSVMILPQPGHDTWSAWVEGGAEATLAGFMPAVRRILSRGFTTPSRLIVMPLGVRELPMPVPWGTWGRGVGSLLLELSSLVLSDISTSLMESSSVPGILSTELVGVKKGDTDDEPFANPLDSVEEVSVWDEPELDIGGLSPTLRRFFDSGPQLSASRIELKASSAVYMRRAIAPRERRMLSICQSVGPSYFGMGVGREGPSS